MNFCPPRTDQEHVHVTREGVVKPGDGHSHFGDWIGYTDTVMLLG